jgi:hypothetical protein
MRHTSLICTVVLTGCLVLQALIAAEPVASSSLIEAEPYTTVEHSPTDLANEVWLKLIEQGLALSVANVQPRDAVIVLAAIKARIDTVLSDGSKHPAFEKDVPTTLDGFEKLFWSMHVFSNQLTSAGRLYDYAQGLKATARKYKPQKYEKIDVTVLQVNWNWNKIELGELRQRFAERDRDLRVDRLKLADKVLTEINDVAERLLAALQLDMDGELLPVLLAKDKTFSSTQLKEVTDTITHARTAAGAPFIQKARWLFTGLHWWVRGRYGMGTAGNGLLKSPVALKSPDLMFGLLMPIQTPIPTAPNARDPVPFVDRRHHYLWQFETRQVASAYSNTTTSKTQFTPVTGTVTTLTHFY